MVSTSYPETEADWKGHFIRDMVCAISKKNDISLRLWAPPGPIPETVQYAAIKGEALMLSKIMGMGGMAHILRVSSFKRIFYSMQLILMLHDTYKRSQDVDIFHVNWLQNALSAYGTSVPMVISALGTDYRLLQLPGMSRLLRSIIKQRRCIIAPNADWMAEGLRNRFDDIADIRVVPFGVDEHLFHVERTFCQENKRVWIVVSRITKKKIGPLITWGENLFGRDDELHLFGPFQENMLLPAWIKHHGPIESHELQSDWYSKATGLITLSQHDEGRPQVVIEAMASGLPVIASNIPAHNDLIMHEKTGCIVASESDFARAMSILSINNTNRAIGEEARKWVKRNIGTWEDCIGRYTDAYDSLVRER